MPAPTEPSSPSTVDVEAIASRRFSTSFRGWNPDEVRVHLVEVAEIVRSLTHRQGELERLLVEAEAAARRADLTRLDADEVARVLGEETASVLRAARDAADEIVAKAGAQAEILARQAADDATATREQAAQEALVIRQDAEETAAATRVAGEAHLADLRAASEAELVQEREQMIEQLEADAASVRAEADALLVEARAEAEGIREATTAEVAGIRADADAYAEARRAEIDAEVAERRAAIDEEVRTRAERSAQQVAEAERMQERILADLSRKRRAARQHLEQLHAGRDRLLSAYEVIRALTDQATGELSVVLSDAKRAADDAARRVASEDLPSPEEMLAELQLARLADLPVLASDPDDAAIEADARPAGDAETDLAAEEVETVAVAEADLESEAEIEAAPEAPAESVTAAESAGDAVAETEAETAASAEPGTAAEIGAATGGSHPPESEHVTVRRQSRRSKHRRDPLGGESLPDVPMVPVDASAEFESVRVVAGQVETATEPVAVPVSDDAVTGIFARLRAEQAPDEVVEEAPSSPRPSSTEAVRHPTAIPKPPKAPKPPEAPKPPAPEVYTPPAPAPVAPPVEQDATSDQMLSMFERRDAAVDEAARRLAKHVKRRLSDEQSSLLDELRRLGTVPAAEEVLGDPEAATAAWAAAVRDDLAGAARAGGAMACDVVGSGSVPSEIDVAVAVAELLEAIVEPLRARLTRALREGTDGADEDSAGADDADLADRIRACYREWRGARLAAAVSDACARAFGLGVRAALPADIPLRWHCGPGEAPCSDCDDNQLAGAVAAGEAFPTGQLVPPAHPGCRCMALPDRSA
ncbi:MAG: hypothetical protein JST73_08180 [Actinobacteria bacterium]|nr:hypothetical protein [Actinomycetota bacterium]